MKLNPLLKKDYLHLTIKLKKVTIVLKLILLPSFLLRIMRVEVEILCLLNNLVNDPEKRYHNTNFYKIFQNELLLEKKENACLNYMKEF